MLDTPKPAAPAIPFDTHRLDRLMDESGVDVLLATSKHNVQYLLGGHRSIFFDYMDATGVTRYLPVLVYPKGAPDKAAYIGHRLERHQTQVAPLWTPETQTSTSGSAEAMQKAVDYIRNLEMPEELQEKWGYKPITDETRAKILGLNLARLAKIDTKRRPKGKAK